MAAASSPYAFETGCLERLRTATSRKVRLTQLDGRLPNVALMKLAHLHESLGDEIYFKRTPIRDFFEPQYDLVYGSSIFSWSTWARERLAREFPGAIIGGWGTHGMDSKHFTVETYLGVPQYPSVSYAAAPPNFTASIGLTQRGCRFRCKWCPVWQIDGSNHNVSDVGGVYRGAPWPRHLHLLDPDFFGQPGWESLVDEIVDGNFKVCWNQGLNIRQVRADTAEAIASVQYYDDQFRARRLYTAWDSLGDQQRFFAGLQLLYEAGVPRDAVLAYMLCGYAKHETWEDIFHRFFAMVDAGVRPYPMVYDNENKALKKFQRWAIRRFYHKIHFADYLVMQDPRRSQELNEWSKAVELIPSDMLPPVRRAIPSGPVNAPTPEQEHYQSVMSRAPESDGSRDMNCGPTAA